MTAETATIDITWSPSEDDHIGASRLIFKRALRRRRAWRGVLILTMLMGCIGVAVSFGEASWSGKIAAVGVASLWGASCMLLCWAFSYLLLPGRVRRLLRQEQLDHSAYRWQWTEAGLLNENANSQVRLRWGELAAWSTGRNFLLFYISEVKVLFVGKRALSEDQIAQISAWAHQHDVPRW